MGSRHEYQCRQFTINFRRPSFYPSNLKHVSDFLGLVFISQVPSFLTFYQFCIFVSNYYDNTILTGHDYLDFILHSS